MSNQKYRCAGYENREEYLRELAVLNGVNPMIVFGLSEILGEEEDFDGLVTGVEDMNLLMPTE